MQSSSLESRILHAAETCRKLGVTQGQIAEAVGASQSQVSRILSGQSERASRLVEEVCLYIERLEGGISPDAVRCNDVLIEALTMTWDGTAAHARALSSVIRSLAALKPVHPAGRRDGGAR
jgi:transcriptional regulator with XRE-family HTH domain